MIVASENILEGTKIKMLHKIEHIWFVVSDEIEFEQIDSFIFMEEEELIQRIPKLKNNLEQESGTTINIDYKTGEININPHYKHIGIPTNLDAKATRQTNLKFSFIKWIGTYKKSFIKVFLILFVLLLLGMKVSWFFYIPFVGYLIWKILETNKIRDMFLSGALNPAIFINKSNNKIAVYTNLSMGNGNYPIIRIKKIELPQKFKNIGERIPIAGTYQNTEEQPFWDYFDPLPIPSGTNDKKAIESKISQIPNIEWITLRTEMKKLGENPKEGYYPIRDGRNDWDNFEEPIFTSFSEEK